ncbi:long-chain fatty acid transport protein 4-like isoform X2 [Coccinella septempunctata]|uniref:long-chain fatty acid transport protein 4-like isoform X2 n=1 Tax=Coccinella septempunctata TaxID=41139 RepID=UPI001D091E19|nr:long-chain fatty acid transport protein 4-like isoform X2 [Coccinella septempunctata]
MSFFVDFLAVVITIGITSSVLTVLRSKLFRIIIKTFPRDIKLVWMFIRLNYFILYRTWLNRTVPKLFRQTVRKYPKKIAFHFEEQKWTFEQVDQFSNQIGNYFKSLGYKRGDTVALLMDSRPEYVCVWLGLAKVGIITALINTNMMSQQALHHAIKSGNSNSIIFSSKFKQIVQKVRTLMPELKMFQFNDGTEEIIPDAADMMKELQSLSNSQNSLDSDIDKGKSDDRLIYIYTSGTTGLPKASIIKNSRYHIGYIVFNLGVQIKPEDVIYTPVPLYHSLGGMCGVSQALIEGATVVIRSKFSASNFWKDCEKYSCTISQYIGEMARYVILAHQNSSDKPTYKLNKMYGNGMKPTTWKQFVEAFNVGQVYEFYGSTEGNFGLFNLDNKIGAVGYIPVYGDFAVPIALIKCNSKGEPIRNEAGFCEICEYNEPGLLICKISKFLPVTKFDGYTNEESTKKKILQDVLKKGDLYFNTGDVLVRDDHGYFYFKDRTGDTFRWKGENVSTTEVEDILSSVLNKDVAVYGVEIPGSEGKAGMAAIVDQSKSLDLEQLLRICQSNLPSYSIPIFLRIVQKIPQTGTFKIQKTILQEEGFDRNVIQDELYFLNPSTKEYVELDSNIYEDIINSRIRL